MFYHKPHTRVHVRIQQVRALVRERLGVASLLSKAPNHRARKRSHRSTTANDAASMRGSTHHTRGPGAAGSIAGDAARRGAAWDGASMVSGVTARSGATLKSKASQPDHVRLPAEYERVIEVLKKRGEKAAAIMAINEVRGGPRRVLDACCCTAASTRCC